MMNPSRYRVKSYLLVLFERVRQGQDPLLDGPAPHLPLEHEVLEESRPCPAQQLFRVDLPRPVRREAVSAVVLGLLLVTFEPVGAFTFDPAIDFTFVFVVLALLLFGDAEPHS